MLEVLNDVKLSEQRIKSRQENAREAFMIYQEILKDISECLKEELTFEQKLILIDKQLDIAKLADQLIVEMKD